VPEAGGVVYITPDPEPEGARVWFFTRKGGVSQPPYESLNISTLVGDDEDLVYENRSRVQTAMGGISSAWVRQVAGDEIVRVGEPGLAGEETVSMVHSGWRGTLSGIAGKSAGVAGEEVQAYIGPCIRRCCYEVSWELANRFVGRYGPEVVSGRQLSLPDAIYLDLKKAGAEVVHDLGLCTGCRTDLFYSHRKQKHRTGRNLAAVTLAKDVAR
jgi:copper oxidase (laccase) domain-containing protein